MGRFFVIVLLAVGIAGGVAYFLRWFDPDPPVQPPIGPGTSTTALGGPLYMGKALEPLERGSGKVPREVVVDACHLVTQFKQDVSSYKDGQLLFVGQELTSEHPTRPSDRPVETAFVFQGDKKVPRFYHKWDEDNVVEEGQMLALIDPGLALNEVAGKEAKVEIARADHKTSLAIWEESKNRLATALWLYQKGKATSKEEVDGAKLTAEKYRLESEGKEQAIKAAIHDRDQAVTQLRLHELRSVIKGKSIIKKIHYQNGGVGVKALEPIVQLVSLTHLRVEGTIDSGDLSVLKKGMRCYIEPTVDIKPEAELKAHRGRVSSVAVCADGKHFVSGGDDHHVYVWERGRNTQVGFTWHSSPVRALACSPPGSPANWLLVGCADGNIYLYDLASPTAPELVKAIKNHHRGAVTALAFSPRGKYFASGGEDNVIRLWNTDGGEPVYPFDVEHGVDNPHQGTITALHFTPQGRLISAARDNELRVWDLHVKGARLAYHPIAHRGGTVGQLGVSQDGRYMLFDQGKRLHLLNMADGTPAAWLDNLAGANTFETLALFSPDGSLLLTGGADDGKLRLWKTPAPEERGYPVRELETRDRSMITCAAFAPAGAGFVVTGSKDNCVQVWTLPNEAAIKDHRIAVDGNGTPLRLDLVERSLEGGKTRVAVNLVNPQDRLVPGQRVTLVVVTE
jgi:WD40 repeat protein